MGLDGEIYFYEYVISFEVSRLSPGYYDRFFECL